MSEQSISTMDGHELTSYLDILSRRQAEYSNLKVKLTEELIPIEQARTQKKADIVMICDKMKQVKLEIAACKYAMKAGE